MATSPVLSLSSQLTFHESEGNHTLCSEMLTAVEWSSVWTGSEVGLDVVTKFYKPLVILLNESKSGTGHESFLRLPVHVHCAGLSSADCEITFEHFKFCLT